MESLLVFDHWLFLTINHLPHTPLSDAVALTVSGSLGVTVVFWLMLSIWLFVREERRDHWFFFPVVVATALSQLVTNIVLKDFFARNRPPETLGTINVGGPLMDYSFPSGHATFAWALAVVLAFKEPRARWFFFLFALVVSISRVYLGKHYPADITAGSVVGIAIGYVAVLLEQNMVKYRHAQVKRKRTPHARSRS